MSDVIDSTGVAGRCGNAATCQEQVPLACGEVMGLIALQY